MATKYTPEQQRVIKTILKVAKQKKASPKEIKAAIETGIVESNLTNPSGGDADSAGWRQERASLYPDPTNVAAAAGRFFDEARQANASGRYGSAGNLAAAVQRPAAQYRGRYQQQSGAAQSLLAGYGGSPPAPSSAPTYQTQTSPGVDNGGLRRQAVASFLSQGGVKNAAAVTNLAQTYGSLKDVAPTTTTLVSPSTRGTPTGNPHVDSTVDALKQQMNTIDDAKVPYLWGGGHAKKLAANSPVTPLDCSGAVSRALGLDPRVASQFKQWGDAGAGKRVTIYAKDSHVLMEVDGHFWGTSSNNPGGGAGWIPKGAISSSYLKGFTARHPPGA